MFVLTTRASTEDDGERSGCLIGFASQCSIDPPRFAVWVSEKNHTFAVAKASTHLGVHVLPRDDRAGLAELFGGETGDEVDKFARCAWHEGPGGVPILDDCASWFVGRVVWRADAGDHDLFLLEPVVAESGTGEREFSFHRAKRIEAGHEA